MKKFCPKCGSTVEKGIFCNNCKQKELRYKPLKIKLCPSKRYFFHGKWSKFKDLRSLSEKLVNDNVQGKVDVVQGIEVYDNLLFKPGLKKKLEIIISLNKEEFVIPIGVEVTYSPGFNKLGSTYFEGILQLRNASLEVKNYIKNLLEKNVNKKIFVNNVVEKKDSADYYFVNKHHISLVAMKVIRNFGGYMIQSPKLFSRDKQTSKDLYRLNVQLTVPSFCVNDIVNVDDKLIQIRKTSKEIVGFDLIKMRKTTFKFNVKNSESFKLVKKQKTSTTIVQPEIKLLNPITYQEENALNPFQLNLKPGQKIVVVENKKKFYIIK